MLCNFWIYKFLCALITTGELNAYDVLCNDTVVFTSSTLPSSAAAESDAS